MVTTGVRLDRILGGGKNRSSGGECSESYRNDMKNQNRAARYPSAAGLSESLPPVESPGARREISNP